MFSIFNATFAHVKAPSLSPPLPPHSHQTNHAQFSVMWSGGCGGEEEMGIDSSSGGNNSWPKEEGESD